jgi:D-3-phosphoglycerate dehydrogenase
MKLICPNKSLFSDRVLKVIKKKFETRISDLSQKEFDKIYNKYEIILLRFKTFLKYNKKHNIKYILSPTTGTNHIDSNFFKDKRVKIFTLQDEKNFMKTIHASSEFTVLLILFTLRKLVFLNLKKQSNHNQFIGSEINNKTVGIIGYGRIGRKVAKILKAFGANILVYEIKKKYIKNSKLKFVSLIQLLKKSDIISIHIPLNDQNKNFLNNTNLKYLKKKVLIINTSRGEVVNEQHISKFVKKKA